MDRRFRIILVAALGIVALGALAMVVLMHPRPSSENASAAPPVTVSAPPPARTPASPPAAASSSGAGAAAPAPRAAPRPPPPAAVPEAPAPNAGALRITTDVPAQVFVDRVYLGAAPATASNLAPGPHQLNVTAEGYDGIAETVDVGAEPQDVRIAFREVRLDASIDVVHKHRIGSCSGRLKATPRALTYDTDNANDRFSVPLTALSRFEVDYLKKNLRVDVNGKTYNFTDPGENADNLFVFHREVEKARERLVAGDPPAAR